MYIYGVSQKSGNRRIFLNNLFEREIYFKKAVVFRVIYITVTSNSAM